MSHSHTLFSSVSSLQKPDHESYIEQIKQQNLLDLTATFYHLDKVDLLNHAKEYADILNTVCEEMNHKQICLVLESLSKNINAISVVLRLEPTLKTNFYANFTNNHIDYLLNQLPIPEFVEHLINYWPRLKFQFHYLSNVLWKKEEYISLILSEMIKKPHHLLIYLLKDGLRKNNYIDFLIDLLPCLDMETKKEIFKTLSFCDESGMLYSNHLIDLVSRIYNHEEPNALMSELLSVCISNFNLYCLHTIRNIYPDIIDFAFGCNIINENEKNHLNVLLSDNYSGTERLFLSSLMPQFNYKLGIERVSHLDFMVNKTNYTGATLTLAQTASRKNYPINCTLINENEIKSLFKSLSECNDSQREKLIFTGKHWMAGEIWIEQPGCASLILLDSFGEETEYLPEILLEMFYEFFPEGELYLARERRQNTSMGCKIFSIDDCIHLFTIENYLDAEYKETGLLGYMRNNTYEYLDYVEDESIQVMLVNLPVRFLQTMQSKKVFDVIEGNPQVCFPINKYGELMYDTLPREFDEGRKNQRLQRKMNRMAHHNLNYLFSHPDLKRIVRQEEQERFMLGGLMQRLKSPL